MQKKLVKKSRSWAAEIPFLWRDDEEAMHTKNCTFYIEKGKRKEKHAEREKREREGEREKKRERERERESERERERPDDARRTPRRKLPSF